MLGAEKLIPIKDKSALVLDDGKIYKIQHKRQRRILSCVSCHKRKIKCNRTKPICDNCTKNNWECDYFVNARVSRGGNSHAVLDNGLVAQPSKEELLKVIEKAKQLEKRNFSTARKDGSARRKLKALPDEYDTGSKISTISDVEELRSGRSDSFENGMDRCNNSNSAALHGTTKDYTHRSFNDNDNENLSSACDNNEDNDNSDSSNCDMENVSNPAFSVPEILKPVWEYLPSSERSDELYVVYIQNVHMILPLVDLEQYELDHRKFWEAMTSNSTLQQPDFLLLLFPILYAAVKSLYHTAKKDNYEDLLHEMNKYRSACVRLYSIFDFPNKYSFRILTGFVLLNSVIENPSVTTIAQLARLCQRAKLTKDPVLMGINSPKIIQSKRILFWQIFQLDTMTSLHNNLSPLIKLDEFDTSLPVEVINGTLNPSLCYINANYRFVLLLNELCQKKGSFARFKERIVDLHVCCMGSALSLNNHLATHTLSLHEINFIHWAMYMLNTLADRSLLLLHLNIISSSIPNLHKRKNLRQSIGTCKDPIVESGYGKDYNVIQTILNNSGNLDLSVDNSTQSSPFLYNFENLTNNLVPASLHFLDEFVKYHSTDEYACFNWELLVGNMPINAITFALKMLALDVNRAKQQGNRLVLHTDLRYVLLSKAIPIVEARLDEKTAISRHCFNLAKMLFELLVAKFGTSTLDPIKNKYDITCSMAKEVPQPTLSRNLDQDRSPSPPFPVQNDTGSYVSQVMSSSIPSPSSHDSPKNPASELLGKDDAEFFDDTFFFSGNLIYNSDLLEENSNVTTSCAQIAPRTMKAISSNDFSMYPCSNNNRQWDDIFDFQNVTPSRPEESNLNSCVSTIKNELDSIYKQVQDYIILLNTTDHELEYVASGDEYYREFENALLEVLCGILTS